MVSHNASIVEKLGLAYYRRVVSWRTKWWGYLILDWIRIHLIDRRLLMVECHITIWYQVCTWNHRGRWAYNSKSWISPIEHPSSSASTASSNGWCLVSWSSRLSSSLTGLLRPENGVPVPLDSEELSCSATSPRIGVNSVSLLNLNLHISLPQPKADDSLLIVDTPLQVDCECWNPQKRSINLDQPRDISLFTLLSSYNDPSGDTQISVKPRMPDPTTI